MAQQDLALPLDEDDDPAEEFPNLPPFKRRVGGSGRPPFWFHIKPETLPPPAMLCNKVFDWDGGGGFPKLRPDRHRDRNERIHCSYVHKWKKLRHSVYERNRLPPDAPAHLRTFRAGDWGTGHGEAPQFEFAFEDTYPTKATRAIEMMVCKPEKWQEFIEPLLRDYTVLKMELPNESWTAVGTQLCYHFSMKEEKCPHWQNCIFLHVDSKRLKEKFKQFRCMCGPNDGLCKYGKFGTCFYAHRQSELTVPPELLSSAYPGAKEIWFAVWEAFFCLY